MLLHFCFHAFKSIKICGGKLIFYNTILTLKNSNFDPESGNFDLEMPLGVCILQGF